MRIVNLVENTEGAAHCRSQHGLSFYIETEKHKLLMDTGASDLLLENAKKLGIDLSQVDTVVLSHGHYDHGGGILPFTKVNQSAKIYIQSSALGNYYSHHDADGEPKYIGIDKGIAELSQVVMLDGDRKIDDELYLFSGIGNIYPIPSTNKTLKMKTDDGYVQDDFSHEQCLVVKQDEQSILFSGCAHHGILNVMERYKEIFGKEPDVAVSGFHLMKKDGYSDDEVAEIIDIGKVLAKYKTVFYTCHCTGEEPYEILHKMMGGKIKYVHCGDSIVVEKKDAFAL